MSRGIKIFDKSFGGLIGEAIVSVNSCLKRHLMPLLLYGCLELICFSHISVHRITLWICYSVFHIREEDNSLISYQFMSSY